MRKNRLSKVIGLLLVFGLVFSLTATLYAKRPNPAEENIVNLSPTSTSSELKIKIKVRDSAGKTWNYTYVPTSFPWDVTNLEDYPKGTNWIHGNGTWEYWSEDSVKYFL